MFKLLAALTACLIVGSAAQAASTLPVRKAFDLPRRTPEHSGPGDGCIKAVRVVHASFQAASPNQILPCGHLLSTDTLVTVHRWDRT